jgi:hypothetical protein
VSDNINEKPVRAWVTKDEGSPIRCYLGMRHRITLRELVDHFAEHYPHVDPWTLDINYSTVVWEEPPSTEDLAQREQAKRRSDERHAKWERETYDRLKAKFDSGEAGR